MVGFYPSLFWGLERIRFMATPGHGQHACSVILDSGEQQIVFCGDAVYAGGKLWHVYNLEWDHWTGTGTLQAWRGIKQLNDIGLDVLCPASCRRRPTLRGARWCSHARPSSSSLVHARDGDGRAEVARCARG